jgi:hypothetical protein
MRAAPTALLLAPLLALVASGCDAIGGGTTGDGTGAGGKGAAGGKAGKGEKVFTGETFAGTGYSFTIPKGWKDRTEDAASVEDLGIDQPGIEAIDVDAVIAAPQKKGEFTPNVTIVRTSEGIPEGVSAMRLANANLTAARQLGAVPPGAGGGDVSSGETSVKRAKLGGEPAAYYEQTADSPAGQIRQRQLYAIQDGSAYALTFGSVAGAQYEQNLPKLQQVVKSWAWG